MAVLADVEPLIAAWEPRIRKAFLDAVYAIRDRVVLAEVTRALVRGDLDAAVAAMGLEPAAFRGLDAAVGQAFEAGGKAVTESLPTYPGGAAGRLLVLFDVRNLRAETWLKEHSSALVSEIVADQRETVRQHMVAGMQAGDNPRKVALELVGRVNPATGKREGGVLGLTASQEGWVRKYAAELAAGDPNALSRKLRDKRFDTTVVKAIKNGTPLSPEQIGSMVAAYRARALKYRADNIARTEAIASLNHSKYEATEQAIESGKVDEQHVTKRWKSAVDARVRDTHRDLHNKTVPFRRSFTTFRGNHLRYPGDPGAKPEERCQCRCNLEIRIDFLAMAVAAE